MYPENTVGVTLKYRYHMYDHTREQYLRMNQIECDKLMSALEKYLETGLPNGVRVETYESECGNHSKFYLADRMISFIGISNTLRRI